MVFCKELNKEFADKKEMFAALKANKDHIIGLKKAELKKTDWFHCTPKLTDASKADENKVISYGDIVYPVINTTNYLDSHGDVHIDGLWDVSIKDQKNKLYYIINHELELGKVISYPKEVEAFVHTMNWSELGFDYSGTTQALIFGAQLTEASNRDAFTAIKNKVALQNSVRMRYIAMALCINDTDPDYKQEYDNFYKYLSIIANKEEAIEQGYFWAITEAAIYKEGSSVLFGSNDATPILYSDPRSSSQKAKIDPPLSSHEEAKTKDKVTVKSLSFNLI